MAKSTTRASSEATFILPNGNPLLIKGESFYEFDKKTGEVVWPIRPDWENLNDREEN